MSTHSIVLHGYLSAFHDGPIKIAASTIAEAVEAITRQLPGFAPRPVHGRHRIKVVGCETKEDLYRTLDEPTEIHIVPQFSGGKKGGMLQILLGAALLGVGFFLGPATALGGLLMKVGALALLGGVSQMFAPQPDSEKAENKSRYLGAPKNTVAIGTRIPILYGQYKFGGHYLSFDINAIDLRGKAETTGGGK